MATFHDIGASILHAFTPRSRSRGRDRSRSCDRKKSHGVRQDNELETKHDEKSHIHLDTEEVCDICVEAAEHETLPGSHRHDDNTMPKKVSRTGSCGHADVYSTKGRPGIELLQRSRSLQHGGHRVNDKSNVRDLVKDVISSSDLKNTEQSVLDSTLDVDSSHKETIDYIHVIDNTSENIEDGRSDQLQETANESLLLDDERKSKQVKTDNSVDDDIGNLEKPMDDANVNDEVKVDDTCPEAIHSKDNHKFKKKRKSIFDFFFHRHKNEKAEGEITDDVIEIHDGEELKEDDKSLEKDSVVKCNKPGLLEESDTEVLDLHLEDLGDLFAEALPEPAHLETNLDVFSGSSEGYNVEVDNADVWVRNSDSIDVQEDAEAESVCSE